MIKLLDILSEKKHMTPAQKKKRGEIYDTLVSQGMESEKAGRIATSKAMAEATFTDKYNDNPKLKGKQTKLPDELQAQLVKEDHEVSMAIASLKSIIKSSVTLLNKLGNEERDIPGWIQDHITNAENYIDQAAQGFHELKNDEMNEQLKRLQELAGLIKEQFYGDYTEDQVRQMLIDAGKDEAEVDDFMNDEEGYFSWSNMVFDHEPSLEDIKNAFEDAFEEWATGGTNSLYDLDEAAKVRTEPQGGGRIELVITSKDKEEVEKEIKKIEREYPSPGYGTFVKKQPFQKGDTWVAVVRRSTSSD